MTVAAGAVVVDASAAHRDDPDVPLVVPGINSHLVAERPKGIIALPGPVTWGLIDAAHVLHQGWELQHLVVTGLIAAVSKSDRGVARLRESIDADLVVEGARTLAFVRSRRSAETVALSARRMLAEATPEQQAAFAKAAAEPH